MTSYDMDRTFPHFMILQLRKDLGRNPGAPFGRLYSSMIVKCLHQGFSYEGLNLILSPLKCGFCKKSFIMNAPLVSWAYLSSLLGGFAGAFIINDFLQNPQFRSCSMSCSDMATFWQIMDSGLLQQFQNKASFWILI